MNFKNLKESISGEERAVSPVIGVILMVAITVILAAVIGTFVLGLGDNVSQNAQAGVTFSQSGDTADDYTVKISVNSIQRADTFRVTTDSDTATNNYDTETTLSVGETIQVTTLDTGDTVSVIASYEGNENVIGEYTVK